MGIKRAGAGNAALHFVEDQQYVMFIGQIAQALHEFLRGGTNTTLALNRLDHERRRFVADRGLGP